MISVTAAVVVLAACASAGTKPDLPPLTLAPNVDLPRFMGDWYVIASIPTRFEKGAHNARESYRLEADGSIDTVFSFRADSFDGRLREFHSRGFVLAPGNAVWGQQYLWPFKADYRISFVADDYSQTVITREKRDWVWIMARTPTMEEGDYQRLLALVGREGYDMAKVQRVPQQAEGRLR
ncbi:MAG: lipocalin family protein [Pseudomonadota bacterium]|nr:lipocalin family protein [Pseudomonadota bacterium]